MRPCMAAVRTCGVAQTLQRMPACFPSYTLPGPLAQWKMSRGPVCECSQDGWLELDAYYTGANRGRDPSDVVAPGAKPEGMTPSDSAVDLMHPQAHPRSLKTNPTDDGHGHANRWLTSAIPCITAGSALALLHCATHVLPGLKSTLSGAGPASTFSWCSCVKLVEYGVQASAASILVWGLALGLHACAVPAGRTAGQHRQLCMAGTRQQRH